MYPGISQEDIKELALKFSIFVPLSGRFSVSAITNNNIKNIVEAFKYLDSKLNV